MDVDTNSDQILCEIKGGFLRICDDKYHNLMSWLKFIKEILSCQPRVTVMSCFVYKVISDLESIDHRTGLIHK